MWNRMKGALQLLAAFLVAQGSALKDADQQQVFDVTTIYRLQTEGLHTHEAGELRDCFVGKDCHDWQFGGWAREESSSYPRQFVLTEKARAGLKDDPHVVLLPEAGLNVAAEGSDMYIFLMAGEDILTADMFVLRFLSKGLSVFKVTTYQCSQTSDWNTELDTNPERKDCTIIKDNALLSWPGNHDNVLEIRYSVLYSKIDKGEIRITNNYDQEVIFSHTEDLSWSENGIFVGLKTSVSSIRYDKARTVLKLMSNHNRISTKLAYTQQSYALCTQLRAYAHPLSGGKLKVTVQQKNGNITVGEVMLPTDKVETVRFITNIRSGDVTIVLRGHKRTNHPVFLYDVRNCNWTERVPKTLINNPGSYDVHARTTAQGLLFLLTNGSIAVPTFGKEEGFPECLPGLSSCSWESNNFEAKRIGEKYFPFLRSGEQKNVPIKFNISEFEEQKFESPLAFYVSPKTVTYYAQFKVILTDERHNVELSDIYLLNLVNGGHLLYVYRCTQNDTVKVRINDELFRNCTELLVKYFNTGYLEPNRELLYEVFQEPSGVALRIKSGSDVIFNTLVEQTPEETFQITHYTVFGYGMTGSAVIDFVYRAASLVGTEGTITSPWVYPEQGRFCVSVVYQPGATGRVELFLERDNKLQKGDPKWERTMKGWNHELISWNIADGNHMKARVVVKAEQARSDSDHVMIQRLAGCNLEDGEDVLIAPQDKRVIIESSGIDVAHNFQYDTVDSTECKNGGRMTLWATNKDRHSEPTWRRGKCVCPPGFVGDFCEKGCGPNRFGDDCGGICSITRRGCKGMFLCRPGLGCDCAAGYHGPYCMDDCSVGEYGVGCRERCGNCTDGACNVFTGVCSRGCLPGGVQPPYCKEYYSYLAKAPNVTVLGYDEISVSIDLSETKGKGTPIFYQIQYKESISDKWVKEPPQPLPAGNSTRVSGLTPSLSYEVRAVLFDETGESYEGDQVPSTLASLNCEVPDVSDFMAHYKTLDFVEVVGVDENKMTVQWKFPPGDTKWCYMTGYEVHVKIAVSWEVHSVGREVSRLRMDDLMNGETYQVKVRQQTHRGPSPFSATVLASLPNRELGRVVNLTAKATSERELTVTWLPPLHGGDTGYMVYEFLRHLACEDVQCPVNMNVWEYQTCKDIQFQGAITVSSTSAMLVNLVPFSVYNVRVTAITSTDDVSNVKAVTKMTGWTNCSSLNTVV